MNIKTISSTPSYIERFLQNNKTKLDEIYDTGLQENNGIGCLGLKCSEIENKMDVFFMTEDIILKMLEKGSWESLKESIGTKKLFLIHDIDEHRIFLVYN